MIITTEWLMKHFASIDEIMWVKEQSDRDEFKLIEKAIETDKFEWVNWYISHRLNKVKKVKYAVFSARLVLHLYENKYPDDNRPRKAIEAAEAYIRRPCKKTIEKAKKLANAVDAAYDTAHYNACMVAHVDTVAIIDTEVFLATVYATDAAAKAAFAANAANAASNADVHAADVDYDITVYTSNAAADAAIHAVDAAHAIDVVFKVEFNRKNVQDKIVQYGIELIKER